jgi:hypothetical protein
MKNKILSIIAVATLMTSATSCIREIDPQTSYATVDQVGNAPGAFNNAVDAITATLTGQFVYSPSNEYLYDLGIPAFYLERDIMGQDIVYPYQNWYTYWYTSQYLGPSYRFSQLPWTYYYGWIKSCNEVISMAGEQPSDKQKAGAGIAYAMRAYFYMDLARMYCQKPYAVDKNDVTVPIVNETKSVADLTTNPRATNEEIWQFILSDLDKAEEYLAGYKRTNILTPDQSVAYGLKARAYLEMEDWANAEKYAKLAQNGYTIMTADEYTDWETGFNTPNGAWMLGMQYKSDDPQILRNDADSSWGSLMCIEINPKVSGCGYAANYGQPFCIDRHLYETIPATDCRKKCYIDFEIDNLPTDAAKVEALSVYSNHPDWLLNTGKTAAGRGYIGVGGLPLKFRTAGGEAGRDNQYVGFVVAVPMMRVEEMYLIEAEAAGMQSEERGKQLLTAFAKTRDANYEYGTHGSEAYYNGSTGQFRNEVWWQRRVELWGEGFATFDIKRLQKGIIRSYAGTNHTDQYQWNVETTPQWMNWCIVQTETNYNTACTNNPDPKGLSGNSAPYAW